MKILVAVLFFVFQQTYAADQKAFIKSCVDSYNNSNANGWWGCWDMEGLSKLFERQAQKNGMTVEQMKTTGFQSQRSESGKVTLTKLIEECEDDTLKKLSAMKTQKPSKGLEKLKAMGPIHHYYYEANSEKKGKLGVRFDIIDKNGATKIMSYNYILCSEQEDCTHHDTCPKKK